MIRLFTIHIHKTLVKYPFAPHESFIASKSLISPYESFKLHSYISSLYCIKIISYASNAAKRLYHVYFEPGGTWTDEPVLPSNMIEPNWWREFAVAAIYFRIWSWNTIWDYFSTMHQGLITYCCLVPESPGQHADFDWKVELKLDTFSKNLAEIVMPIIQISDRHIRSPGDIRIITVSVDSWITNSEKA